jgi:DNA-binding XRE family transcriptional regulator
MKKKYRGIPLRDVLKDEMQDPEFRFYFERARALRHIARLIRMARIRAGLTQGDLAKKVGTSQSVVARLESSINTRIPSLNLLERIATAFKARLSISFEYPKAA